MTADDLIDIAWELARRESGRPRQVSLKRAVSTAYYALFHALAYRCVDLTIGWSFRADRYWETVSPLYRTLDHAAAKSAFNRLLNDRSADTAIRQIARTFIDLQSERLRAGYDPKPSFTGDGAAQSIERAAAAIALLRALPVDDKRLVMVQLIGESSLTRRRSACP